MRFPRRDRAPESAVQRRRLILLCPSSFHTRATHATTDPSAAPDASFSKITSPTTFVPPKSKGFQPAK